MSDTPEDPYEILGCASSATAEELKRAYRKAAAAAHPDRDGGSKEQMQRVNWAWSVLGDSACRAQWDGGARETVSREKIMEEARKRLADMFSELVERTVAPGNVLEAMLGGSRAVLPDIDRAIGEADGRVKKLERWVGIVRRKDKARGFIDERLDNMIKDAKSHAASWRVQRVYLLASIELLEELENGYVAQPHPGMTMMLGGPPIMYKGMTLFHPDDEEYFR